MGGKEMSNKFAVLSGISHSMTDHGKVQVNGDNVARLFKRVLHEAVGNGDIDTQAYFRTVTIEYV